MQWKSTLAYLKDPPQGYARPSVDLLSGLDDIANKLSKGGYTNDYAVQIDISSLLKKACKGTLKIEHYVERNSQNGCRRRAHSLHL